MCCGWAVGDHVRKNDLHEGGADHAEADDDEFLAWCIHDLFLCQKNAKLMS